MKRQALKLISGSGLSAQQWVEETARRFCDAGLFFGHGTDNATDEAAWLVLAVMGQPPENVFSNWARVLDETEEQLLKGMLDRRINKHLPAAYVTGSMQFAGLEFEVNGDVLVPRSPIAELIGEQFVPWVNPENVGRILDLCTGSGCIAVATAKVFPEASVDAVDISLEALAVARRNVDRHSLADRVDVIHSDLFQSLAGRLYDLIVANPPYVAEDSWRELPAEYHAEPILGLLSGEDGLDACLLILQQAHDYLTVDGVLICEVGESDQRLATLLPNVPFTWLEFVQGGYGVFVLSRQQLSDASEQISQILMTREQV